MPAMVEGGAPGAAQHDPRRKKRSGGSSTPAPSYDNRDAGYVAAKALVDAETAGTPEGIVEAAIQSVFPEYEGFQPVASEEEQEPAVQGEPGTRSTFNPDTVGDLQARLAELRAQEKTQSDTYVTPARGIAFMPQTGAQGDAVSAQLAAALRAERAHALGMDRAKATGFAKVKKKTDEMTDAEYYALGAKDRAAVDFNTIIADAVRKDKIMQDEFNLAPSDEASYNAAVEGMFGADGGSEMTAPNTVNALQQLGFSDPSSDLDDFLQLRGTLNYKELKDLGVNADRIAGVTLRKTQEPSTADPVDASREALNDTLVGLQQDKSMSEFTSKNLNAEFPDKEPMYPQQFILELAKTAYPADGLIENVRAVFDPLTVRMIKNYALSTEGMKILQQTRVSAEDEYRSPEEFRALIKRLEGGDRG